MSSLADTKQRLDQTVTGFAIPIFRREDPATGRMLNGLGPRDYQRILDGYGCPDCLAQWELYLAGCPLCGWQRNIAQDVAPAPDEWRQHIQDRNNPSYGILPTQDRIEQALADVHADPDVEHIALSKLKPKRRYKPAPTTKEQ